MGSFRQLVSEDQLSRSGLVDIGQPHARTTEAAPQRLLAACIWLLRPRTIVTRWCPECGHFSLPTVPMGVTCRIRFSSNSSFFLPASCLASVVVTPGDGTNRCQHSQTPETTDCLRLYEGVPSVPTALSYTQGETVSGFPTAATALSEDRDSPVSDATMRDGVMSCSV